MPEVDGDVTTALVDDSHIKECKFDALSLFLIQIVEVVKWRSEERKGRGDTTIASK